ETGDFVVRLRPTSSSTSNAPASLFPNGSCGRRWGCAMGAVSSLRKSAATRRSLIGGLLVAMTGPTWVVLSPSAVASANAPEQSRSTPVPTQTVHPAVPAPDEVEQASHW